MKKLQVWGWLISGFLRKHKKIIFLGITLGMLFAIFTIWILPYIPRPNPYYRIGVIGQYRRDQLPWYISSKVSQGLTAILDDGSPSPALADRWTVDDENGKIYTFYLRDNLYWQDGTKVTTDSLSYHFADVEVKKLDSLTIQFILKDSFAPFPTLVSQPILKDGHIGTGEFRIRKIKEKGGYLSNITLESNKETQEYKFYPNLKMATTAFELGEIEEISEVYKNPWEGNLTWKEYVDVAIEKNPNQYVALFINNSHPNFKDKTFRQALSYATPKPKDETRVLGPISAASWAYNPDVKPYDYDPKRAKELLEKSLGSLDKAQSITIKLSTTQTYMDLAEVVKKSWEENLGLHVEIQVINSLPNDYEVLLASQESPSDPDQYALWHSTQTQNFVKFNSKRIDKILEDARRENDTQKREALYSDFQRFFIEESPVIFLTFPQNYTIKRKSVVSPAIRSVMEIGRN